MCLDRFRLTESCANLSFETSRYQDLSDLEDSISEVAKPEHPLKEFDTSCFSGIYVTGEKIGDEYFKHLHALRNDEAQEEKRSSIASSNGSSRKRALASNDGCEPMNNDTRSSLRRDDSCEALTNKSLGLVR